MDVPGEGFVKDFDRLLLRMGLSGSVSHNLKTANEQTNESFLHRHINYIK